MDDEFDAAEKDPSPDVETTVRRIGGRLTCIEDRLNQLECDYKSIRDNCSSRKENTPTSGFSVRMGGGTVFAIFAAYWLFKGAAK